MYYNLVRDLIYELVTKSNFSYSDCLSMARSTLVYYIDKIRKIAERESKEIQDKINEQQNKQAKGKK
jgi:hypothetical protein